MKTSAVVVAVLGSVLFLLPGPARAWEIHARWNCCGRTPRERVQVRCPDGRMPAYVNLGDRWCKKTEGAPDEAGPCHRTLDEAATAWCAPKPPPKPNAMPSHVPASGNGWKLSGEWKCCGTNPRQRVMVKCSDGRVPSYVFVENRWCKLTEGRGDADGPCFPSLDEAAQAWCSKNR